MITGYIKNEEEKINVKTFSERNEIYLMSSISRFFAKDSMTFKVLSY